MVAHWLSTQKRSANYIRQVQTSQMSNPDLSHTDTAAKSRGTAGCVN